MRIFRLFNTFRNHKSKKRNNLKHKQIKWIMVKYLTKIYEWGVKYAKNQLLFKYGNAILKKETETN